MKTLLKYSSILILFGIVVIFSCRKENADKQNASDSSQLMDRTELNLKDGILIMPLIPSNIYFKDSYKACGHNDPFYAIYKDVNQQFITDLTKKLLNIESTSICRITFYLSTVVESNSCLDKSIVNGISCYVKEGENIYHSLYVKNGNSYILEKKYSCKENTMSSANMPFLLFVAHPKNLNGAGYLSFINKDFKFSKNLYDGLKLKRTAYYMQFLKGHSGGPIAGSNFIVGINKPSGGSGLAPTTPSDQGNPGPGGDACGPEPGCEHGIIWTACLDHACRLPDDPGNCSDIAAYTVLDNNSQLPDPDPFDFDLHHEFRDNFLVNTYLGYKYIHYYYGISEVLYDNSAITIPRSLSFAAVLPALNSIIPKLLSPSGHETEVLVNSTLHDDLTAIIDDIRNVSSDQDYLDILDDLQNDLDWYEGKTVSQILALY